MSGIMKNCCMLQFNVIELNLYYITSAYGTFSVSFPIIFDFLIIPESVQSSRETVHRLSLDYCIW